MTFTDDTGNTDLVERWVAWARDQGLTAEQVAAESTFADLTPEVQTAIRSALGGDALDVPPPNTPPPQPPEEGDGGAGGEALPDWLRGVLSGGGPLGNTEMSYLWWTAPVLGIEVVDGGVKLTTTSAEFVEGQKWVPDAGRWYVGQWFMASGNTIGNGEINFKNVDPPVQAGATDNVQVWYELDDAAIAEIDAGEEEHKADFVQAFLLSYQALVDTVSGLTEQVFQDQNAATTALAAALRAAGQGTLMPADPSDLESWTTRLGAVADRLESQSQKRDKAKEHSTTGFTAVADGLNVTLRPQFNNPHRASSEVIVLSDVAPDA